MIVWLASYPRSGNTLLRTVYHQTMGVLSASDEPGEERFVAPDTAANAFAEPGGWDVFYDKALQADRPCLIKTHRPPRDDQPAIYIVRDGRKALLSYLYFHRSYSGAQAPSLLELVLGGDFYGDWSEHYRTWMVRENTLLVRYEDLVEVDGALLQKLAQMADHTGEIAPWHNPFDQLHQSDPRLFRQGVVAWEGDSEWTPFIDAVFFHLHGDLMVELGYATPECVAEAKSRISSEVLALVDVSRKWLGAGRALAQDCREKQAVIEELDKACKERLALINQLSAQRRGA